MVWSSFLDACFVTFNQSVLTSPPFWLQRLPKQWVPAVREPQGADLCDAELFWGVDGAEHQRLLLRPETHVHPQPRPGQVRTLQGRVHLHLHKRRLPSGGRLEKVRHLWRQDRATGESSKAQGFYLRFLYPNFHGFFPLTQISFLANWTKIEKESGFYRSSRFAMAFALVSPLGRICLISKCRPFGPKWACKILLENKTWYFQVGELRIPAHLERGKAKEEKFCMYDQVWPMTHFSAENFASLSWYRPEIEYVPGLVHWYGRQGWQGFRLPGEGGCKLC